MPEEQLPLSVQVEDAGPCTKKVKITVPAARVDREIEDTYRNVQKNVQFRGFRPGKAPRRLVEARLGDRVLMDVRERLVQPAVEEAIRDEKLQTLGDAEAEWDAIKVEKGADLSFEVSIDVRPEFETPDLATIRVERPHIAVDDAMIDRELERLQMERASAEDGGEGPVEARGVCSLHVRLDHEGETIVDETGIAWVHPSDVLGGMLVEGLAAGLLGKKVGETAEFDVTLPDNFRDDELRGKPAHLVLTIESIQRVILPELNDAFAAELDYDDLEELRGDIRKQLERQVEGRVERALDERIVDAVLERVPFDLPPTLVRRETGRMLQRYQTRLRQDGIPDDQITEELARAHAEAETRVKRDLRASFVLDRVAAEKKVFATESEVHQELARMGASYNQSAEEMEAYMEQNGLLPSLRASLRERKAIAELRKLVTITAPDTAAAGGEGDDA